MNQIIIYPNEVKNIVLEGINFPSNTFIEFIIDGEPFHELEAFEDGTVYWPELLASAKREGDFLLFTCVCGVAQDAGWELIKVSHTSSEIIWEFVRNGDQYFVFEKQSYIKQIEHCAKLLNLTEFPLAIEHAAFPD